MVWAARRLGRTVRWTSDRSEAFLSDTQARDQTATAELALDADGRFLAIRAGVIANIGAPFGLLHSTLPARSVQCAAPAAACAVVWQPAGSVNRVLFVARRVRYHAVL